MESRELALDAYAKLNLSLEIGERKPDGFHDIWSIFHSINLGDRIQISLSTASKGLQVQGAFGCPPEKSTVWKAATEFIAKTGVPPDIDISVEKHIPSQAGLGGGSSDAAAVLRGLDELFKTSLSANELSKLGSRIGSDVPFFIAGGAAFVGGRGERVRPIQARQDFFVLLAQPPFGISTAWAYAALDGDRSKRLFPVRENDEVAASRREVEMIAEFGLPLGRWSFVNDFMPSLERRYPVYSSLFTRMKETGARFCSISGSGSCAFGLYEDGQQLHDSMTTLRNAFPGMILRALRPLETSLAMR